MIAPMRASSPGRFALHSWLQEAVPRENNKNSPHLDAEEVLAAVRELIERRAALFRRSDHALTL